MARSTAAAVSFLFAESSVENESVHFSFNRVGIRPLNIRIPACQLGALIQNLQRVQEQLEDEGVSTGKEHLLVPAAPHGFFK